MSAKLNDQMDELNAEADEEAKKEIGKYETVFELILIEFGKLVNFIH